MTTGGTDTATGGTLTFTGGITTMTGGTVVGVTGLAIGTLHCMRPASHSMSRTRVAMYLLSGVNLKLKLMCNRAWSIGMGRSEPRGWAEAIAPEPRPKDAATKAAMNKDRLRFMILSPSLL
jgi:hypothetical protein